MKFTLSWLKEHLETDATLDEITDALTDVGLELEGVENMADALAAFKVCKVKEARQHPNADRLRVCDVETVDGMVQVVCGAPNARTGMTGMFAPAGAYIPGTDMTLQPGNIRGEDSNGMLCSEHELMISENHDGIIDLPDDLPVGMSAAEALGLDEPVIDVGVTPNRPDALGVRGIARDMAAKGIGTLKPLDAEPVPGGFASPINVSLQFEAETADACPLFHGRYVRGVKNDPSPDWMQKLLRGIDLRPISALVDITNYVNIGLGRPLHVFDADKVKGDIHVRLAKSGEKILALDGKEYALDDTMTVIADDNGPEAIGGVMGGELSGCTEDTVNVFLESAYFDPIRTATTGRKLNIISDARYRFERGVDPTFTPIGAEIGTRLILELCGGEASEPVSAGEIPNTARAYTLRGDRMKTLAGIDVPLIDQTRILEDLGFGVTEDNGGLVCDVPPWRPDVHGEADLVEEVVRIVSLNAIPNVPLERLHAVAQPVLTPLQIRTGAARRALAARGLNEAVTWSFLPEDQARLFGGGQEALKLDNPISNELSDMRPSLLPNLIAAVGRNVDRGFDDVALAEIGQVYAGDAPEDETVRASGVRRGMSGARDWTGTRRAVDLFDAKADALAALTAAGAPVQSFQVVQGGPDWFHPGRSGTLQLGPKNQIVHFGELHPRVLAALDVKGPLVGFEITLNNIPVARAKGGTARAALDISDLQAVTRDFAFVVDTGIAADALVRAARGADKKLITDVAVFDLFKSPSLGEGKKSLAIAITLQPRDKTLTDEEIDSVAEKVVTGVAKATGGMLRG